LLRKTVDIGQVSVSVLGLCRTCFADVVGVMMQIMEKHDKNMAKIRLTVFMVFFSFFVDGGVASTV
jgi:hypothetical protein